MRRRRSCLEAISALMGRSESDSIQRHKPISVLKGQGFPSGERYGRDQYISWGLGVLQQHLLDDWQDCLRVRGGRGSGG
jgi:hypothetical protein